MIYLLCIGIWLGGFFFGFGSGIHSANKRHTKRMGELIEKFEAQIK